MSQAILSPTTNRRVPSAGTIYLPEVHLSSGRIIPEVDLGRCSMADVVEDISQGQIEKVVRVLAMNVGASECWDVSSAIAAAVLTKALAAYGAVPTHCEAFLEVHLGIHNVREAEYEHRMGGAHERSRAA